MSEDVPKSLETAADADRPRGILTPSDRDFLLGRKTDYTEHSKKQKRNRIRRRVRNAVIDFSILFEHLEQRDRETVFDPKDEDREAFTQGIIDMLAFLHLGSMGYHTPFKEMLAEGVGTAEQRLAGSDYRMVNVEFNVDPVGQIDVDEVVEKIENDEFAQLTDEELRAFVRLLSMSEEFSPSETRETIKDNVGEFVRKVNESEAERERAVEELTNRP
ncbi:ASCH domain-containing protein [Halopenitus persicus]|uniref:ASCH domain-containing protein n=1 Tax=Halopenitus persicus TaxID=1048396 RepID=UPI000BBA56B3|nr:ASCH domain-containing protein [Halopenitus persicus]